MSVYARGDRLVNVLNGDVIELRLRTRRATWFVGVVRAVGGTAGEPWPEHLLDRFWRQAPKEITK